MRERRDPWKWPVTVGLTAGLLWAVVFWLPRSWLSFLLPNPLVAGAGPALRPQEMLTLLPPLVVVVQPDPREPPPAAELPEPPAPVDPRWWTDGWAVTAVNDTALFNAGATAPPDTVGRLLQALGLGDDFMTWARPDSILAARLFELRLEEGFDYDELKPYLSGLARSRAYADILSRAADMYNEHLAKVIQVPD